MAFDVFNQTVIGRRRTGGAYVNGLWVWAHMADLTLRTSVQAPKDSDLQLLPEGRRTERAYVLYSKQVIREADILNIYGDDYEVLNVAVWQNGIIPHYKAIAVKMTKMETEA